MPLNWGVSKSLTTSAFDLMHEGKSIKSVIQF